jgi:hypothetical protein
MELNQAEFKTKIPLVFIGLDKNIISLKSSKKVYKFYVETEILDLHVFKADQNFFIKPKVIVNNYTGIVMENVLFRDLVIKPKLISSNLKQTFQICN